MRALALALVLSLLAGCASPSAPSRVDPAAAGTRPAPASSAAGAAATDGATGPAAGVATTGNATAVTRAFPLALKGTIPTFASACAFTPVFGTCMSRTSPTSPASRNWLVLPFGGAVNATKLTLKYDAGSAPVVLGVGIELDSLSNDSSVVRKSGPSPLTVDVPSFTVPDASIAVVYVYAVAVGTDAAGAAHVGVDPQDIAFDLAGSFDVAAPPEPATTPVAYRFAGSLPAFAQACSLLVCEAAPPTASFKNVDRPVVNGTPRAADLTLSWTSTSPATETLLFALGVETQKTYVGIGFASGKSPLKLEEARVIQPPGARLVVSVYVPSQPMPFASTTANPADQPFTIAGTWSVAGGFPNG